MFMLECIQNFLKTQSIDIDLLSNFDYIIWMDAFISIINKNFIYIYILSNRISS